MIVDASALVAVVQKESDAAELLAVMLDAGNLAVPTPTLVEATVVLSRRGPVGPRALHQLLSRARVRPIDFTEEHAERAAVAHSLYGRGTGHPARLNYGDCLVYGVASVEQRPLLFTGDDFVHTDLVPALER